MAFRLVSGGGDVNEPAFINVQASGVITPNAPVELILSTTGAVVGPAGVDTTRTILFGVGLDYVQGASDTSTRVIPFTRNQIWDCDCANAASTAQVGVRHYLSASRGFIHNQATDTGASINRVFLAIAMTGSTSGSGRLIGRFLVNPGF